MRARLRRLAPYAAVAVVLLVLFAALGAWLYFDLLAYHAEEPVSSVERDYDVSVERGYDGYVIRGTDAPGVDERVGLVFYPGGRVAPDAYLRTLAPLAAEHDVTVVVPGMPLNLAVLDQGKASDVVAGEPNVTKWYVGGHSLGGAMACRYASNNADVVTGLFLAASYCDVSIRDSGLSTLAVAGSRDAVLNRETFQSNQELLPENATIVEVSGMNHSQFGSYGGQGGDQPGTISTAEAHERVVDAVVAWLCGDSEAVSCAG